VTLQQSTLPRCESLLDLIGNTPVLRVRTPFPKQHPGFWAKLEGCTTGGMKARAALSMIQGARFRGELAPGGTVVESSSGTLALGLAFVGTALGHPVAIVADREIDAMTRNLLRSYGAELSVVSTPHPTGGWQRARLDRVHELLARLPQAYWPDQYNNPDNALGYRELGLELVEQCGELDAVVCSVGTGGHSAGIASVVREIFPDARIIGVDTPGSAIFGQPNRHRVMRGLGSSIHPANVCYEAFDEVHWVGPAESVQACRSIAADTFVAGGWSTGAVGLVAAWCAWELGTDRVAAVFPDGPHRYWHTVYDDDFCRRNGLDGPTRTKPIEVDTPADAGAEGWFRCRNVQDPCALRTRGKPCPLCG
jgi:cysteine synthase